MGKRITFHTSIGKTYSSIVENDQEIIDWFHEAMNPGWFPKNSRCVGVLDGDKDFYLNVKYIVALVVESD